jgi:hypothetical protein
MTLKYDRTKPVRCRVMGRGEAWFYVSAGAIWVVVPGATATPVITRRQLEAALKAMRPLRKRKGRA